MLVRHFHCEIRENGTEELCTQHIQELFMVPRLCTHQKIALTKYISSVVHGLFERVPQVSSFRQHNLSVLSQAVENV